MNYILWYFIVGLVWLIVTSIGAYIVFAHKFGIYVVRDAGEFCLKEYTYHACTTAGKIWYGIWCFILWPVRVEELAEKMEILWKKCEELYSQREGGAA